MTSSDSTSPAPKKVDRGVIPSQTQWNARGVGLHLVVLVLAIKGFSPGNLIADTLFFGWALDYSIGLLFVEV